MMMNRQQMNVLLNTEDEMNRQAHAEEVEEMRLARDCGEYDCGEDDENCTACDYEQCPKKVEAKPVANRSKGRRERRRKNKDKQKKPGSTFAAPNYEAYLKYAQSRRPILVAAGKTIRDCNAIIFEEWHSMDIDAKIPFYPTVIER